MGVGAKAMGKAKGVLGISSMEENENNEMMVQPRGPEPIPPEEMQKNGTRPKALKNHPTQNGRGRSPPPHRVAKQLVLPDASYITFFLPQFFFR